MIEKWLFNSQQVKRLFPFANAQPSLGAHLTARLVNIGVQYFVIKLPKNEDIHLRSALFWDIAQRVVAITYRRFGTTYTKIPPSRVNIVLFGFLTRGDVPDKLPDTSVGNHHFLLRNSAEDCSSHLLRC
jgi:hypothetical protein